MVNNTLTKVGNTYCEKILNIIVFYNNLDEVVSYIKKSINASGKNILDFAIVINRDDQNEALKINNLINDDNNKIILYNFNENVGYLNALLKVITVYDTTKYSKIILSNTDISFITNNFFGYLLNKTYPNEVGCIAPSVYSRNSNSYSNPHYKKRIPKQKLLKLIKIYHNSIFAYYYIKLSKYKSSLLKRKEEKSQYVYSPHGCYMIFTQQFIKKIKGNYYGVLMYSEESYIGEMLMRFNQLCYYDSNIKVEHIENTTTNKIHFRQKSRYISQSLEYILKEFYYDNKEEE